MSTDAASTHRQEEAEKADLTPLHPAPTEPGQFWVLVGGKSPAAAAVPLDPSNPEDLRSALTAVQDAVAVYWAANYDPTWWQAVEAVERRIAALNAKRAEQVQEEADRKRADGYTDAIRQEMALEYGSDGYLSLGWDRLPEAYVAGIRAERARASAVAQPVVVDAGCLADEERARAVARDEEGDAS